MKFFSIPISAEQLIRTKLVQKEADRRRQQEYSVVNEVTWVTEEASIQENVRLMLFTNLGSYHHAPSFGCALQQFDFYMPDADRRLERFNSFFPLVNKQKKAWHDKVLMVVKRTLELSIQEHEPRLQKKRDAVGQEEDWVRFSNKITDNNRFRVTIQVMGLLQGKEFRLTEEIELPLKPPHLKN